MPTILQTIFSNAFSWIKMYEFQLNVHCSLFLRVQSIIFQHWFRQWFGANQATSHYWKEWWLDYRRIYAPLSLNELNGFANTDFGYLNSDFEQTGKLVCVCSLVYKWIIFRSIWLIVNIYVQWTCHLTSTQNEILAKYQRIQNQACLTTLSAPWTFYVEKRQGYQR